MKKTSTLLVMLIMTINLKAQDYNTGIGLRGGLDYGITIKHFINKKNALEGIFTNRWRGYNFTGLYEYMLLYQM